MTEKDNAWDALQSATWNAMAAGMTDSEIQAAIADALAERKRA